MIKIVSVDGVVNLAGELDEFAVEHLLHIEQMNVGEWWMRLGDASLTITIEQDGRLRVDVLRGFYDSTP